MFGEQISNACIRFPINNKERFLLYPALAVYSPLENLVKTVVGIIFTALSLVSLGLCPPINNIANWTRYSRGFLTIPLQIIGNIFELHSEILTDYNITSTSRCAVINGVVSVVLNNSKSAGIEILEKRIEDKFKSDIDALVDIRFWKAKHICTKLFQTRTASKTELLAKHIIFRIYSVVNGMACLSLITLVLPIISVISIPFAVYNRGKDPTLNDFVFRLPETPEHIHTACLTLRMIVNPL